MRFDIPHDQRRYIRSHEPDLQPPPPVAREVEPTQLRVPASPLTRRVERLQERARENHAHYIAQPRRNRSIEPDHDPVDKPRQVEHRPRRTREGIAINIRGLRLRPEEQTLLAETGRFRVLAVRDVVQTIYGGDERRRTDLRFLRDREVIRVDSVAARNDGRWLPPQRIEVVTLTEQGLRLAYETGKFTPEQKLYHGLVKPREAEHDTQIYRAYLKEAEQIERAGARISALSLILNSSETSTRKCTLLGNLNLSAISPRSSRKWPNASICHISITKLKFQTLAFITSLTRDRRRPSPTSKS